MCVGGKKVPPPDGSPGSAGTWCYDQEGTQGIKNLLAQTAQVGVDIAVFGQNMNNSWRSLVGNEFVSALNISWLSTLVDIAHAAGTEIGSYVSHVEPVV